MIYLEMKYIGSCLSVYDLNEQQQWRSSFGEISMHNDYEHCNVKLNHHDYC